MKLVAKTLFGLEDVLEQELNDLGVTETLINNRAVLFEGNLDTVYRVNYLSRLTLSLLVSVDEFKISSAQDLYNGCKKIAWDEFMNMEMTFAVVPVVNSPLFNHSGYPGLLVKDALADYFREKYGSRPSVNTRQPDLLINLHISNDKVGISLDSSGLPLFMRGYRKQGNIAPLNEVLAAGILKITGWDEVQPLYDPMCGSGTFAIEAALMAGNIAPGKTRSFFGFQNWSNYSRDLFQSIKEEATKAERSIRPAIAGSDISFDSIRIARANLTRAGLTGSVRFFPGDFFESDYALQNGIIVMNPPYGERIRIDDLETLYEKIGTKLKHFYPGNSCWIITSDTGPVKAVGLKPGSKSVLYNGPLKCTLSEYNLFQGKKADRGADAGKSQN